MDEPALMELAQSRRNTDGEAQEVSHLDGHAEQPIERLAPLIVEHQHGPTAIVHEVQWRTAHAPSSSSLSSYSWLRRSRLERDGWSAAGITSNTARFSPLSSGREPRRKTRSPSSHKTRE